MAVKRSPLPDSPRSILLIRLTARGDVVFASPIVRALRRTYPQARISWLGESHTMGLIEHHPELHRVLSWDRKHWKVLLKRGRLLALAQEATRLMRDLREERFDVVIDLQGLFRSGVASFLTGANHRIVLRPREWSHLFATHVYDRDRNRGNRWEIAAEYRFLAEELGLDTGSFRMEVPLHPRDRAFAGNIVHRHGLGTGFAVAIPHASRPQKHWMEGHWAALVEELRGDLGLRTVFLGGPMDQEPGHRIRLGASGDPVGLEGQTSLREAAAIIEQARLVIGVDTGLTHVGIAFDRPTVGIFGPSLHYTKGPNGRTRILTHWLDCVPCKGNLVCGGAIPCVREVSVEDVLKAAREVMNGHRNRVRSTHNLPA